MIVPVPTGNTAAIYGTSWMKFAEYTVTAGDVAGWVTIPFPGATMIE